MAILDTYFEIAFVSLQSREEWFFAHKYILNTMNITYAKIKKKSLSRFFKSQPARASLNETLTC